MERREIAALARVLTIQVRETIAAELRDLKNQVQEVKVYVDQRIQDIKPPLQVKGEPGKDADPVDYVLVAAQIQAEVERRLESSLRAAIAEIPIINGIDGKDVDMETVRVMVHSSVKEAVEAQPKPRDGKDAEPVNPEVLVAMVRAAVDEIPRPKDGIDGKDAPTVDVQAIISEVVRQIPTPINGKDGRSIELEEVRGIVVSEVQRAVAAMPAPKDGKDADPVDYMALTNMIGAEVDRAVSALPLPKDGKDGMDGKDAPPIDVQAVIAEIVRQIPVPKDGKDADPVDADSLYRMVVDEVARTVEAMPRPKDGKDGKDVPVEQIEAMVTRAIAGIPPAKDGKDAPPVDIEAVVTEAVKRIPVPKDGKDAEPVHPDTLALMVSRAVEAMPKPKDGEPGRDGRDALNADILPTIDESKSYPRGTVAKYRGGLWKAIRTTEPADTLQKAGWEVIIDGFDSDHARAVQGDDLRTLEVELPFASGKSAAFKMYFPVPIYRDVWRPNEEYKKSDMVQRDGSVWICLNDGTKTQPGMPGAEWKLAVKRGAEAKPGKDGAPGPPGKPGRDGRDLTQVSFDGSKH